MAGIDEPTKPVPGEWHSERTEPVIPGYWGPNLLVFSDISKLLLRVHHNVSAHMDAHKRLMGRLQSVFAHEQALVLELARVIDEATAQSSRKPGADQPATTTESMERIFEHASKAMEESGRMITDIQLEALSLLKNYMEEAGATSSEPEAKTK